MKTVSPEKQWSAFLARFSPEVVKVAKLARAKMRQRMPRAIEMVYDNYAALVIGYSPNERPSEAILSIVIFPRWVTICLTQGKHLPDPQRLLKGNGNQVRTFRLDAGAAILDTPAARTLISEAIKFSGVPFKGPHQLVIRAIAKKQRPRR